MFSHKTFNALSLSTCALVACVFPTASSAQERLTKENIESFYAQSASVQMRGKQATIEFLETHMHDDSKATLHMITNMAGIPPQKQTTVYDKKKLLKETAMGYDVGEIQSVENKVLSVDIAQDGRSAKVKDTSYSIISLAMPAPYDSTTMRSEQSMLCDGTVILNDQNIIQTKESTCNVEVNVAPVQ